MPDRKLLGAWYTPPELVGTIVTAVVTPEFVAARSRVSVLDPACGDGRFLAAVEARIHELGGTVSLHGVDIDASAVAATRAAVPTARIDHADALTHDYVNGPFDLVIGNPPFLSQMAARTSRGGSSERGGGPYADVAVEFLALASGLAEPDGGRVAFVLPQSVLTSRDAGPVRDRIASRAALAWSWWTGARVFDAQVLTCALAFEFGCASVPPIEWSSVVTSRQGVPPVPDSLTLRGRLGDRAILNANFRDEYYGMVPAVGDHDVGPPLVSSGLIDPGVSWWGHRPITFAKQRWDRPRVDLARLDPGMQIWASRRLVPKVLVANQTRIVEAVCDPNGEWLPAVPVIAVYPTGAHWDDVAEGGGVVDDQSLADAAWEIAAVLGSSCASAWLWHRGAGSGLSANSIRISPVVLAELPWPAGDLGDAVAALRAGDIRRCAAAADAAYGISGSSGLYPWWEALLKGIEARRPVSAPP